MTQPLRHEGADHHTGPQAAHAARRNPWLSGYWFVLALLSVSYLVCALQESRQPSAFALLVQLVTVAVTLWVAQVQAGIRQIVWIVLGIVGLAVIAIQLVGVEGRFVDVSLATASLVAYLIAPIAIIAHQSRKTMVDGQTLLASIAAYVMVGMFFTFVFNLIALLTEAPLFGVADDDSLSSLLFFSFTTLTTTGYGNLVPVGAIVQTVAIIEAITGQLFLVIAVARVVSGWRPPRGS